MKKWTRILYQPGTPLGKDGRRVTASPEHIALSKNAAKEGMVLLKNEGELLPFAAGTRLALVGKGTFDYVKGGGGSGDVTVSYITNLYEGIKSLGEMTSVDEDLAAYYRNYVAEQYKAGKAPGMIAEPEVPEALLLKARAFTDTAVISISRFSGEGWDRSVGGQKDTLFEKGDFYLSDAEAAMVEKVCKVFPKVCAVLNVGGMVNTGWFHDNAGIQSVLMAWQGGMEGGKAAAELLFGFGNPSGKLSDTFAGDLTDYPGTATFHESDNYVAYTEDIYVGYRYFETVPGKQDLVLYPFGFGLSYTDFCWAVTGACEQEGQIRISAWVTNTGKYAGREVLQAYVTAPQGKLGKAAKSLVAFRKTRLLQPGETQILTLEFATGAMASYDDLGKVAKSAYVLEKGDYRFFVGTSVRDGQYIDYTYSVAEDTVTEQLMTRLAPTCLKERMLADGSFEPLPQGTPNDPDFTAITPVKDKMEFEGVRPAVRAVDRIQYCFWIPGAKEKGPNFNKVADGTQTLDDFIAELTDDEIAHLLGGQPNVGVANTWGFGNLPQYHVPSAMTADGPAGLRITPECGVCTTAFPCATLLACTWDPDITFAVGQAGAKEVKENNIAMWLTPAVNIHRSPLCGRNFEYYSEDPFLVGAMAAGMVKGIQSMNISPSVKHFALNDKETNRKNSDSRVSERAAREIYLKGFEIIVKTAQPWCIMSSYNIINGHRASENYDLLTGILRDEWGYQGMVTTDWWTSGEHYKEVLAGNDLKMASGFPERLKEALDKGVLSREDMVKCAKRILNTMLKFD